MQYHAVTRWVCGLAAVLVLGGAPVWAAKPAEAPDAASDLRWLGRVTYGIDAASVNALHAQGRKRFLEAQLRGDAPLPAEAETLLAMLAAPKPMLEMLADYKAENQRIKSLPEDEAKPARRRLQDAANQTAQDAAVRHLVRAVYSPNQLKEQMVWFWLNHFSVFQHKNELRLMVGDYEDRAIRPYALGRFRDLVMATLQHPAMQVYLDNTQNTAGKINENYARELMELHTLGVEGGYTQQDVQELARILTGVGVRLESVAPRLKPEWQTFYLFRDGFEFNPARHDFGAKNFLGKPIDGQGFAEVEQVVDQLCRQPATAQRISRKLATYFLADTPPESLVRQMAASFLKSDGRIDVTLQTLFSSREMAQAPAVKFKDPMHYVVSSLRFAFEGKQLTNLRPAVGWLGTLGEPLYGHQTPDGYGMLEKDWASSGQLSRRFEIARAIGAGNASLFDAVAEGAPKGFGFPMLANRLYFTAIEMQLAPATRAALERATSQQEWNALLLASPDWMYH